MPTGPPSPVCTGPFGILGLCWLGRLPKHKIKRIELAVCNGHALASPQFVQTFATQFAVTGETTHRVVHVALGCPVGQALGFQFVDDGQHVIHILCRTGFVVRAFDAQGVCIVAQCLNHAVGQAADAFAVFNCTADDLVVNIGDVANVGHSVARCLEPTLNDIKCHHGPRMTQMAQVVHSHAAHVHADMTGFNGLESLALSRKRVVNMQTHRQ